MPAGSSRMRRRTSSSARRATSARSCSFPRSCTTEPLALLELLGDRLGNPVVRVTLAEFRELLFCFLVPALALEIVDALQPLLGRLLGELRQGGGLTRRLVRPRRGRRP